MSPGAGNRVPGRKGSARIAVLTITNEEFAAGQQAFQTGENINATPYYVNSIKPEHTYDIIMRKAPDRGNTRASQTVGEILEDFRPDFVLVVGTAGGIHGRDGTQLGDVIVADFILYSEFQKRVQGKVLSRYLPYDQPSLYLRESHAEPIGRTSGWADAVNADRPGSGATKVIVGHIVAGDKFLGDPADDYLKEVLKTYDNAVAVDMESMGVAMEVFRARRSVSYNPQYLVIRGISDLVDNPHKDDELKRGWRMYAAAVAAAFGRAVTDQILRVT